MSGGVVVACTERSCRDCSISHGQTRTAVFLLLLLWLWLWLWLRLLLLLLLRPAVMSNFRMQNCRRL